MSADLPPCCVAPPGAERGHVLYAAHAAAATPPGVDELGRPIAAWGELSEATRTRWRAIAPVDPWLDLVGDLVAAQKEQGRALGATLAALADANAARAAYAAAVEASAKTTESLAETQLVVEQRRTAFAAIGQNLSNAWVRIATGMSDPKVIAGLSPIGTLLLERLYHWKFGS